MIGIYYQGTRKSTRTVSDIPHGETFVGRLLGDKHPELYAKVGTCVLRMRDLANMGRVVGQSSVQVEDYVKVDVEILVAEVS